MRGLASPAMPLRNEILTSLDISGSMPKARVQNSHTPRRLSELAAHQSLNTMVWKFANYKRFPLGTGMFQYTVIHFTHFIRPGVFKIQPGRSSLQTTSWRQLQI